MKSVLMAVQNLSVAFGDVLVIILIPILDRLFSKQVRIREFLSASSCSVKSLVQHLHSVISRLI